MQHVPRAHQKSGRPFGGTLTPQEWKLQLPPSPVILTPWDHISWHDSCQGQSARTADQGAYLLLQRVNVLTDSTFRPTPQHVASTGARDNGGSPRIEHLSTIGPGGERPSFCNVCGSKYSFVAPFTTSIYSLLLQQDTRLIQELTRENFITEVIKRISSRQVCLQVRSSEEHPRPGSGEGSSLFRKSHPKAKLYFHFNFKSQIKF